MKSEKPHYFKVAAKAPLFEPLTYSSPGPLEPGQRVKIPLGSRQVQGLVLEETQKEPGLKKIKEVLEADLASPPLSPQRVRWLKWLSDYYHYPLGLIADLSFLPFEKSRKKASPAKEPSPPLPKPFVDLTSEQKACLAQILKEEGFHVHLIHGVTASGKTEIYARLIERALGQKQQALALLPEIFLSPQILKRLERHFPDQSALLHSQVTARQKRLAWQALLSGKKNLLIGTRSALFCPLPRLGLVIIDEEHDSSFKQEGKFRYQARDSAIVLAKELNIPVVLGSATPDFSSYHKALTGSYRLYELKKRAFSQKAPKVTVVDLKNKPAAGRPFWLSDFLFDKISETLRKGRQSALFLNRRGQARALICPQCGHAQKCRNCDISLTLHKGEALLCHYCSYFEKKPDFCPSCKSSEWLEKGIGAQGAEKALARFFPDCKILRADRDSIQSREDMESFISAVEREEAQIIIGTQMLAKGLNFPSIYLVGLILADMDFQLPDFRAEERAFQTLLQMSGRAGRASFGEAALQTFNPNHPSILFASRHDYKGFFHDRIKSRKRWGYPPFSRLCLLRIDSLREKEGGAYAEEIACRARGLKGEGIEILGPSPAPLAKIKSRWRFQVLIKGQSHLLLDSFLKRLWPALKKRAFAQVKADRDPSSML